MSTLAENQSAQRVSDQTSTSAHPASSKPDPTTTPPANTTNAGPTEGGLTTSAPASTSQLTHLKIRLRGALRSYQDFPTPGIVFEDILPIFADPSLHKALIDALEIHVLSNYGESQKPDVIVGLDARGFLFGPTLALRLGASFVPVRKKGKLPGPTATVAYQKEYGKDYFQMQVGGIQQGQRVIVVDDIIATGGSAVAAGDLVRGAGGNLLGFIFMLELNFLKGRDKLNAPAYTLLSSQESKV